MVQFDFDQVDELSDFQSVPAGRYVCRIHEVRRGIARDGSERWSLKWVVDRGSFLGRFAAWDNLVFSERAARRVRTVLQRLGIDGPGKVEINPEQLVGRRAVVMLVPGEWVNPTTGERVTRLQVPWDGYQALDGDEAESGAASALSNGAAGAPPGVTASAPGSGERAEVDPDQIPF